MWRMCSLVEDVLDSQEWLCFVETVINSFSYLLNPTKHVHFLKPSGKGPYGLMTPTLLLRFCNSRSKIMFCCFIFLLPPLLQLSRQISRQSRFLYFPIQRHASDRKNKWWVIGGSLQWQFVIGCQSVRAVRYRLTVTWMKTINRWEGWKAAMRTTVRTSIPCTLTSEWS